MGTGPWTRAGRTLALGLLLGLTGALLVLAGIALVERGRPARLDPDLPPEVAEAARQVLPNLDDSAVWRLAADVGTPFGRVVRLRPYLQSVEVRGADCVVHLPRDAEGGSSGSGRGRRGLPERGLPPDHPGSDRSGTKETGQVQAPPPPRVRFERNPHSLDWSALAVVLAGKSADLEELLARTLRLPDKADLNPLLRGDPGLYASAADDGWTLRIEVSLRQVPATFSWKGVDTPGDEPVDLLLILDPATQELREARDLRFYQRESAGSGLALVFDPNPVAVSGDLSLRDGDPVDGYRVWLDAPRLDGTGYLRGRWIETVNDRPPRAWEPGLIFSYPTYDPRFEEAMAYVHGDRALQRVEDLGFAGLFEDPLRLRVHGTQADNSWYSRPTREIVFGDGGVDDAEDADIILHELGHAIHDALVPGFDGGDTYALSEGFSDFWAAALTDGACIGDWDATSYSPPCLRRTDTDATYPASLNGRPHHDGQIWSATLWDLRGLLGAETAERLALASFLEQNTGTTFEEAARGLMIAAERLGLHNSLVEIRGVLEDRGLMPRTLRAVLAMDETYLVPLAGPARIPGGWARSLVIQGDGRLFLPLEETALRTLAPLSLPFPQGPPCIAPLALGTGYSSWGASTPVLQVHGSLATGRMNLELEWTDDLGSLARAGLDWDLENGRIEWEYLNVREGGTGLYCGVSRGGLSPDSLQSLVLSSLPPGGMTGLAGFRADLGDPAGVDWLPNLVGAGFALTEENEGSGLWIRNAAPAMPAARLALAASPNPFADAVRIRLRLQETAGAHVSVFDVQGRLVRNLLRAELTAGVHTVNWDGRDDEGRAVPSAVYWVRAAAGGEEGSVRVLRLRR